MLIPKFLRPAIVFYILISLCGLTQVTGRTVHGSRQDQARTWIHAAMNALGGEDRLRAIHAIEIKGIGFRNELEQSERPEGPWLPDFMNGQIVYRGQEKLVAPYFGFQPGAINRWREADFPRAFSARLPDRRCRSNPIGAFANGMFGLIP